MELDQAEELYERYQQLRSRDLLQTANQLMKLSQRANNNGQQSIL